MRTICIWQRVDHVSHEYHCEGGAVVVGESIEDCTAKLKAQRKTNCCKTSRDYELPAPDVVGNCDLPEGVTIFPDAGCC